jgi:hypothetical protein
MPGFWGSTTPGEAKPVPHLGIDEKNFGKGQDSIPGRT